MTILRVYEYPEEMLRQLAEPVRDFGAEFQRQVDDVIATMGAHTGAVGLAATQVGIPLRFFVTDLAPGQPDSDLQIWVNPQIGQSSRWKLGREGCLSFPEYLANVKRARRLQMTGQDRYGQARSVELEGFMAIVVQHELDHLNGVLMIDHIRSISRDLRPRFAVEAILE